MCCPEHFKNTNRSVWGGACPHPKGCVSLSLIVSGLLGLNLLYALSAIIAERAQAKAADVTWSAGWRLGNYVGQLLDCLGIRKPEGRKERERGRQGGGEGLKDSAGTEGEGCHNWRGFLCHGSGGKVHEEGWGGGMREESWIKLDCDKRIASEE